MAEKNVTLVGELPFIREFRREDGRRIFSRIRAGESPSNSGLSGVGKRHRDSRLNDREMQFFSRSAYKREIRDSRISNNTLYLPCLPGAI